MSVLQDFENLVKDENGSPYGQGYAFTVGSEFSTPFVVNLATLESGEVLVFVAQPPDVENLLFDATVASFEQGVQDALVYLAEHAEEVLRVSEPLL